MIEFEEGDDALYQIRNFPGSVKVMETPVAPAVQQEFFRLNRKITGIPDDHEISILSDLLFEESVSEENIKSILVKLTNSAEVKAFRSVERFAQQAGSDLRSFALLCLEISRMRIENSLGDEDVGYIAGGLGGFDQKLRFFLLVFPAGDDGFTAGQLQLTQDEFRSTFESIGGVAEVFDAGPLFLAMVFLLPVTVDLRPEAEKCLKEINQYGNFLFPGVYATNVEIPSYPKILDIISQMRHPDSDDE